LPTKYGQHAKISNSIVADGCQIEGTVANSVICRNVKIMPGAVVKNSILQENTVVGENSEINWIITDRGVIISGGRNLIGHSAFPVYIDPNKII
jgi:glucose-1-phosphate adenylyltransferase